MQDAHYRLLRLIESRPDASQRELAREMGVSLGKVNYCVGALIEKGLVEARNFNRSRNKLGYAYLLTPRGAKQKAKVTIQFLKRKISEYELLKREIKDLRREVATRGDSKRSSGRGSRSIRG